MRVALHEVGSVRSTAQLLPAYCCLWMLSQAFRSHAQPRSRLHQIAAWGAQLQGMFQLVQVSQGCGGQDRDYPVREQGSVNASGLVCKVRTWSEVMVPSDMSFCSYSWCELGWSLIFCAQPARGMSAH